MQSIPSVRTIVKQRDVVCRLCGGNYHLQIHHIIWKCYGGTDELANLILLCSDCHMMQHSGQGLSGQLLQPVHI
jgi:5-methylcytosine-specific restriction endonuclease McrA